MNDLLRQAFFLTKMNTGGQTQVTKNALTELSSLAAQMEALQPTPKENVDDEICAIVMSQIFFEQCLEKKHLQAFEYLRSNRSEHSTIYGFPVFISSIVQNFKVLTRREYKLLFNVLNKKMAIRNK